MREVVEVRTENRAIAEDDAGKRAAPIGPQSPDGVERTVIEGAPIGALAFLRDAHGVALGQGKRHRVIDIEAAGRGERQRHEARHAVQALEHDTLTVHAHDLKAFSAGDAPGMLDELHDHAGAVMRG